MGHEREAMHTQESMLAGWLELLGILNRGHFNASKKYGRANDILGGAVVIATAVVGSAIFASLGKAPNTIVQILAGLVSLTATVLAALQKFLGFADRAQKHQDAACSYGILRKEVQVLLAGLDGTRDLDARIDSVRTRWDEIEKIAPTIPERIYQKAEKTAHSHHTPPHTAPAAG